jgi:hypothetical protein
MQAEMLLSGNKPRLFADAAFSQVQVMTNKPKPRPGDVIFVNSPDFETLSVFLLSTCHKVPGNRRAAVFN